jgi:nucleotide-binding universal stress UspA family protein
MFRHIMLAIDGSPHSDKAIALALRVADSRPETRISALLVVPDQGMAEYSRAVFDGAPDAQGLRDTLADDGRQRLVQLLTRHGDRAGRIVPLVTVGDRPFEDIIVTAAREHCDLIVMAPRGPGAVTGTLLGSQTQRVLSKVPLLVAP